MSASPYRYLESRLEEIEADGCDHCQGEVEILEVPTGRFGLYAEVVCLKGGSPKCFERINKVWL
jgi:hypothetical protein